MPRFVVVVGDAAVGMYITSAEAVDRLKQCPTGFTPSRMICEVVDGKVAADPQMLSDGTNQGSGGVNKYWLGWDDIERMNAIAQAEFDAERPTYRGRGSGDSNADDSHVQRFVVVVGDAAVGMYSTSAEAVERLKQCPTGFTPSRMICEVVDGKVAADPQMLSDGTNQGGGGVNKYWLGWDDIERMNAIAQAEFDARHSGRKGPGSQDRQVGMLSDVDILLEAEEIAEHLKTCLSHLQTPVSWKQLKRTCVASLNSFFAHKEVQHNLTDDQTADLKKAFHEFDEDGDGCISLGEFGTLVRFFDQHPTEGQLRAAFAEVDANNSGTIEWPEFLLLMAEMLEASQAAPAAPAPAVVPVPKCTFCQTAPVLGDGSMCPPCTRYSQCDLLWQCPGGHQQAICFPLDVGSAWACHGGCGDYVTWEPVNADAVALRANMRQMAQKAVFCSYPITPTGLTTARHYFDHYDACPKAPTLGQAIEALQAAFSHIDGVSLDWRRFTRDKWNVLTMYCSDEDVTPGVKFYGWINKFLLNECQCPVMHDLMPYIRRLSNMLTNKPHPKWTVTRGMTVPDATIRMFTAGAKIRFPTFLSTSRKSSGAEGFAGNIMLVIHVEKDLPNCSDISRFSPFPEERRSCSRRSRRSASTGWRPPGPARW